MADPAFGQLVSQLLEAIGQSMAKVRESREGILVQTSDGFLYAFVADPTAISLANVRRWIAEVGEPARRLVVLGPSRLPLALAEALERAGATLVEGGRFHELVRGLGLGQLLGDAPRAPPAPGSVRMLPSVQQLEEVMLRARSWLGWGVPALALRFYRQAAAMKPEYLPARTGAANALLALGLLEEAERGFEEVLQTDAENLDAKLGRAALLGRRGDPGSEIAEYRRLLLEDPNRFVVRAHLVAALVARPDWPSVQAEVHAMISVNPEDPALRFLHAAALHHVGRTVEAREERARALALGLTFDREKVMAAQLGLSPPEPRTDAPQAPPVPPKETASPVPPTPTPEAPRPPSAPRGGRSKGTAPRSNPIPRKRPAKRTPVRATKGPAPKRASPKGRRTR